MNQLAEILSYRPDINEGMLGLFVIVLIGFIAYRVRH